MSLSKADTAECNQSAEFKHICLCGGCITADSWPSFINQAWINSELMSHVTSRVLRVLVSLLANKMHSQLCKFNFSNSTDPHAYFCSFWEMRQHTGRNNMGFSCQMDASKSPLWFFFSPHCVIIPNRCCCYSFHHLQTFALISL